MPASTLLALLSLVIPLRQASVPPLQEPFGIEVVDAATGRGVPLVTLTTTGGLRYVTDSAGRVAFDEPGLLGRRIWFHVESHGYEAPADGFGYEGAAFDTEPGGRGRMEVRRTQVAERLYRQTGAGLYRDSLLLGEEVPLVEPLLNGGVLGQDSVVTARLGDRVLWFWGDTNRAGYPLGLFETAGAWSAPPEGLDPERGIDLHYFTNGDGFARAMCPIEGPGPVWIGGLCVVPDEEGSEGVLVAHYARMQDLGTRHEHGLARWDPEAEVFRKWRELPLDEERHPRGHPVELVEDGTRYFVFPVPYPHLRVEATLEALADPARYEAYTCLEEGAAWSVDAPLARDAEGVIVWAWRRGTGLVTEEREHQLVEAERLAPEERLVRLVDVERSVSPREAEPRSVPQEPYSVRAHNGSLRWNEHRGRWVWLVNEVGGRSSYLGEVWYAEADTLLGPWVYARQVVTHDGYSFYNVAQHDFLARESGRFVYFEGTYTRLFARTRVPTPRYDYNQVMYRLDLEDARLELPQAVYAWGDEQTGTLADLRAAGLRATDARLVGFRRGDERLELPVGVLSVGGGSPQR